MNGTVGAKTFFTIKDGLLIPADKPTAVGTPYFKLLGNGNFTEGAESAFGFYDLEACKVDATVGG